jgi:Protein of unknown function (DUF2778)
MPYESERGDPETTQFTSPRGPLTLLFDGYYLKLLMGSQVDCAWHARSGLADNGSFHYDAEQQKKMDVGPIPEGAYWIMPKQIGLPSVFAQQAWGNYRITIHYFRMTNTFGRGGFFIHGGESFGSKGCIDLARGMDLFVHKLTDLLPNRLIGDPIFSANWKFTSDSYIPLTVKYAAASVGFP